MPMEALRGRGGCTRRGAWVGVSEPIRWEGVTSRAVGGPGEASVISTVRPSGEEIWILRALREVSAPGLERNEER